MTGGEGKKATNSTERKGTRKAWKGKIKIFKVLTQRHPPLGMFELSANTLNQN